MQFLIALKSNRRLLACHKGLNQQIVHDSTVTVNVIPYKQLFGVPIEVLVHPKKSFGGLR